MSVPGSRAQAGEPWFLTAVVVVIFAALAFLAAFFLAGESRRARLLLEYEADRTASALLDAYRRGESLAAADLDTRVLGFGVYAAGEALVRVGQAPSVPAADQDEGFTYDRAARVLLLVRPLGISGRDGPGMMRTPFGMGGMMRRGGPAARGMPGSAGRAGVVLLRMDARGYYRSRAFYAVGAAASPLLVAGLAAVFLSMAAANRRYRRSAEDRELLARLGEAAHTLAHEIRNPLGAIRIQTGLLRRGGSPSPSTHLDIIDEEVGRLTLLSRRVGDFLKNPRGNPRRIALAAFLRELLPRMPWPVSMVPGGDDAEALFDGDLLRSVVENLVRNAHESYGEERDEASREVAVAVTQDHGAAQLSVLDRGKGIAPDRAGRVFGAFETDKPGGSGIGLAISLRFVQAAGGTIRLLPRDGGGTEARVTLPRPPAGGDAS